MHVVNNIRENDGEAESRPWKTYQALLIGNVPHSWALTNLMRPLAITT